MDEDGKDLQTAGLTRASHPSTNEGGDKGYDSPRIEGVNSPRSIETILMVANLVSTT